MDQAANNKRIAKNAVMLYIRTFISMILSLYTSRVVLQALGVSDYGVYTVVGGVTSFIYVLCSSVAAVSVRYITFALGTNDLNRQIHTFSTALQIHVIMALFFFVIAETVGLWFITYKLVIPEGRLLAAHIVFQCSMVSSVLSIALIPYTSSINAHENMNIYAYLDVLSSVLKLVGVLSLMVLKTDRLVLYGILLLGITLLRLGFSFYYSYTHYPDVHYRPVWDKKLTREMLAVSGWSLVGQVSDSANLQGTTFIVNMFYGTVMNAAFGIANTVQGVIRGFTYNVIAAFRPQLVKQYAATDYAYLQQLMENSAKFTNALFLCVALPVFVESSMLLQLWLVEVPPLTSLLLKISLIGAMIAVNGMFLGIIITATARVKAMNAISLFCNVSVLGIIYVLFLLGFPPYYAFVVSSLILGLQFIANLILIKRYIPQLYIRHFLIRTYTPNLRAIVLSLIPILLVVWMLPDSFQRMALVSILSIICYGFSLYKWELTSIQREKIKKIIICKLSR